MERWMGRVAIVTGASAGIGAAIARLLAESGMKVVGVARREERVKELAASLKASKSKGELHAVQGDVTKEEDVVRVVKWARDTLGGADVLVNNAGVFTPHLLSEVKTEDIRRILDTNILGLCMYTHEVLKDMKDRGVDDGHIFHISSILGQRISAVPGHGVPGTYVYSCSKHAVRVLTEGLRRELRDLKTKIRVTSISPGLVETEVMVAGGMTAEESKKLYDSNVYLQAKDVADALLYALATPPHVQIHEITIEPLGENF